MCRQVDAMIIAIAVSVSLAVVLIAVSGVLFWLLKKGTSFSLILLIHDTSLILVLRPHQAKQNSPWVFSNEPACMLASDDSLKDACISAGSASGRSCSRER
jgi:hypothetical protein